MNHPTVFEFIISYIYYPNDMHSFQKMSLLTYIATINQMRRYTYYTTFEPAEELPMYARFCHIREHSIIRTSNIRDSGIYWPDHALVLYPTKLDIIHLSPDDMPKDLDTIMVFRNIVIRDSAIKAITAIPNMSPFTNPVIGISNMRFMNMPRLKNLEYGSSWKGFNIHEMDTTGLFAVETIGDRFLMSTPGLRNASTINFPNLRRIGSFFMGNCEFIKTIDTRQFGNGRLIEIGEYFMTNCIRLHSINLAGLVKITKLPNFFMIETLLLTSFNFQDLPNLTEIGDSVFFETGIKGSIELSSRCKITRIGNQFLCRALNITMLKLSGLQNLETIGNSVAAIIRTLKDVIFNDLPRLVSIGDAFASGSEILTNVTITNVPSLKSIGHSFLLHCSALVFLNISNAPMLETIGYKFCEIYRNLRIIELVNLPKVFVVGNKFLLNNQTTTRPIVRAIGNISDTLVQVLRTVESNKEINLDLSTRLVPGV